MKSTIIKALSLGISAMIWLESAIAIPEDPSAFDTSQSQDHNVIMRDVCIIGGGSAGTFAAIRLRQMNQSVVVVEREDHLGGHVNTYNDMTTGTAIDYGVLYYEDLPLVRDYFGHFGIPLERVSAQKQTANSRRVDLRTGTSVGPVEGNMALALAVYTTQLLRYPYLNTGFNLPNPVPPDLLLPFGEFVKKYKLDGAVDIIALFNQGVGDLLQQTTLYMMKYFGLDVLQGALTEFLQPVSHNNSELYVAAQDELGKDALLSSAIISTRREEEGKWVKVRVSTPSGEKLIRARRLIVAIPPKLDMLQGIDLDPIERGLFEQFNNTCYYTALVKIPGLPQGLQVVNRANDTAYNLPPLPAVYVLNPTRSPNLTTILYGSKEHMSENEIKEHMTQSVLSLRNQGLPVEAPEFVRYSNHSPFLLTVPPEAIANGFYRNLNGLQGNRNTYWMSATFNAHDSAQIWLFADRLLRSISQSE
ncbi:uncharacterized protein BDW43DRAFT_315544 [Aspergillus alliaceus]|uniref:uncharacterized protein n=1 Tax=Petromyces alliaceus TaxID=209559 RepID=UPI0012A3B80E|nr:uncharacterized protein BDW43DRAFT_315544 [Aspergillus alliaceus]KAB8228774.1 hypothetical protein BDW43DRAFT_315544 [Aspergillus alliaceus]